MSKTDMTPENLPAQPMSSRQYCADPRDQVSLPAIFLMIVAGLDLLLGVSLLVLNILGLGASSLGKLGHLGSDEMLEMWCSGVFGVFISLGGLLLSAVVLFGANQMRQLKSWGLAVAAAIISVIPCVSPCCFVGIPFGIWALVVLMKQDVKAAFT